MKTYISKIDGKYYAFAGDMINNQVVSIGADNPPSGQWCAKWTDAGIKYVSTWSPSREAARKKAQCHGEYVGEV